MKRLPAYILLLVLVAPPLAARAAATRVYAKVDTETTIYPGDEFVYSIVVEGGARPSRIDLSPLASFSPRRTGSGTFMETINGRMTVSYSENYAITAGKAATMRLPAVTVVVDGRSYTTEPVELTISQPGTTDRMRVELTVSETKCYVGQPLLMTVKWFVTARWQGVAFDVPVFKADDFYLEEPSESGAAAAAEQVPIHGVPTVVKGSRQLLAGMETEIYSFRKVLIPKRPGRLTLAPVAVSANVAVGRVRTNDFFNPYQVKYERASVRSAPVELEVLPLPEAGKPLQFYGLVGRYTIAASATPTRVNVGDPITLTIRIGGGPYLTPVQWPALEQVPELVAGFKIPAEKASPVLEAGGKVFTQTIRANSEAVTEIPPIPLAYFDPQQGEYVVARTEPIRLEVAPTKVLTDADVEGTKSGPVNREVEAIQKGLSANYYGPEVLVNQSLSPLPAILSPGYAALWSIPLAGLIVSAVVKLAGRTSPESLARKRRRRASTAARRSLREVVRADPQARPELLLTALKGYIGDRFDRVAASLTADDCHRIIAESVGDARTATQYQELIMACEQARYAPLDARVATEQAAEPRQVMSHVIDLIMGDEPAQARPAPLNAQIGPAQVAAAIEMIRLIEKRARK